MLRFDEYQSEAGYFMEILKADVENREEELITVFIQQGPEAVRLRTGAVGDEQWRAVFDRLVLNGNALMRCVKSFMPFFVQMVVRHGPAVLREIFDIRNRKYDCVFEQLFDLVAVGNGALYDYVYMHRDALIEMIKRGDAGDLRKSLCPYSAKYDEVWEKILRMLLDAACDSVLEDKMNQDKIKVLEKVMEAARGQRPLRGK
jgi:hypothetical protein